MRDIARERFRRRGQNEPAIFFVFEQTFGIEPLDHVGDAGLRDFQAGRDIDDAGVALGINQFQNAFEIIFDRGRNCEGGMRVSPGTMKRKSETIRT